MKVDVWMPLFVADYLADTTHLDTELHGAYLLLLMSYWRRGEALPDEDRQLAAMARMSVPRWLEARPVLADFFAIADGLWVHGRVEHELAAARERMGVASTRARKAAKARYEKEVSVHQPASSMLGACSEQSSEHCSGHASITYHLPPSTTHPSPPQVPAGQADRAAVWDSYREAYALRYGVDPTRNAAVNSKIAAFVKRVPAQEAPAIAAWFVRSNKRWYVDQRHAIGCMLSDAEALRTDWLTGQQRSETEARQADATQSRANAFQHLLGGAE